MRHGDNGAVAILVLAAGQGTRMKSDRPKVMQSVLDEPMIAHVLRVVEPYGTVGVVIGHGGDMVREYLDEQWPQVTTIWQRERLGTGHAVMMAREWLQGFERVLIVNGDMPLLDGETVDMLFEAHEGGCSFLTFNLDDPHGYGRVVRGERVRIVEERDCTPEERLVAEVNAGVYLADVPVLLQSLESLNQDNAQGEYYLVDSVVFFQDMGVPVVPVMVPNPRTLLGVNDPRELAQAGRLLRDRLLNRWMAAGVKCVDPDSVWIGADVSFLGEAVLFPNVQLWGKTIVGIGASIASFSILRNANIGEQAQVKGFCCIEDSAMEPGSQAGPFCYMRQGSVLGSGAFAGKFVEVKNSRIGEGSKVPHLSYMGDTVVGTCTNVGAGTITCNYDGTSKHGTIIGDDVFVGSDTMLVAPVHLGDRSMTGAGSIITRDVPEDALAIARARQRHIEGWRARKKTGGGDHRK
ncbi:MAG: UDP-N-acetylglucosamine diphosphorylase/glucosamine-1-phosphate N-acetyltransferase [Dethiosulfovibrio peptidovorans]|nr:MAG: UDP-N-acetylglucosamine diphosphorylase/glucosamine-1-phosphate N-acetyltransferase [Dethiosulfovibrio peptidovorans]